MPIWGFFAIWLACGLAIALIIGKAMRAVDENDPTPERQVPPRHEVRTHAHFREGIGLPVRRNSR